MPLTDPHIVVWHTDDQEAGTVDADAMPSLYAMLSDEHAVTCTGATFTLPLCNPHRSSMLTGLRTDHHGMVRNQAITPPFDLNDTILKWVQDAGYRVGWIGKGLHGIYTDWTPDPVVPAGVDFMRLHPGTPHNQTYYGWTFYASDDGETVYTIGDEDGTYSTDQLTEWALEFLDGYPDDPRPMFLYINPFAPHSPYTPAPRHGTVDAGGDVDGPAFNPPDGSPVMDGKPDYIANRPVLTDAEETRVRAQRQDSRRTLRAVDEQIVTVSDWFTTAAEADNLIRVYQSDNGYLFGDWRTDQGYGEARKKNPYWGSLHNPLVIFHPLATTRTEPAPTVTPDTVAAICEWTGATPSYELDGVSYATLIETGVDAGWRPSGAESFYTGDTGSSVAAIPKWWALYDVIDDVRYKYAEYPTVTSGVTVELYDLDADEDELTNIADTLTAVRDEMAASLALKKIDPIHWTRPTEYPANHRLWFSRRARIG